MSRSLNFDLLARPYRWLEYATFGPALERCRLHFLSELTRARRALVVGDGDGRFLARLLKANPMLEADVVDISPTMLRLLQKRIGPDACARIMVHKADAREFIPPRAEYDLVVTHFFLDCLFQEEMDAFADRIVPRLAPGALWVDSEFAMPPGRAASLAGAAVISSLYTAFRLLTGLQVRSLPDHCAALRGARFRLTGERKWLRGLLVSQLWQLDGAKGCNPS